MDMTSMAEVLNILGADAKTAFIVWACVKNACNLGIAMVIVGGFMYITKLFIKSIDEEAASKRR